jgi:hypothetical protein
MAAHGKISLKGSTVRAWTRSYRVATNKKEGSSHGKITNGDIGKEVIGEIFQERQT